jgi:hypothetical protein
MSGSNQGPLAKRLDLPKGRKKARKMVQDTLNLIAREESLTAKDRDRLKDLALAQMQILEMHGQSDNQKEKAVNGAYVVVQQIRRDMLAAKDIRDEAIEKVRKARDEANKNIFTALIKEAEQAGLAPSDVPIIKEWRELSSGAMAAIWRTDDKNEADQIANQFEIAAVHIAGRAGTSRGNISTQMAQAKKKSEDTKAFETLMEGIANDLDKLEVLTGDIDTGSDLRTQQTDLNKRYRTGSNDITEGLERARQLRTTLDNALSEAEKAGEKALEPLKQRFEKQKASKEKLEQVKTRSTDNTGLDIDLPYLGLSQYWPLVDEKIEMIERLFKDKIPASGASFVEAQLDEVDKMLTEVKNFHLGDDEKLQKAIDEVDDLIKRKKYMFFDTDLQKYLPNDSKVLNAQYESFDKDCAKMKPLEVLAHIESMKKAAETANSRAQMLKTLCETTGADKLKEADKELEAIVKQIPQGDRGNHKTFHGEYRIARDELAAALKFGGEGPDETKIRALMAKLDILLADIKPGGKYNATEIGKSHKAGLQTEEDEKQLKLSVKNKRKELSELYKTVEDLVKKAEPGDDAELQAIKRLMKEVNATADKLPPKQALERYEPIQDRLERLQRAPAGMAVLARGKLPEDHKRFVDGLAAAVKDLESLEQTVNDDYTGSGQQELVTLIRNSVSSLYGPEGTIKTAVDGFAANAKAEQLPGRLKARETGLSAIRQYNKLLADDAVITKLIKEKTFSNEGVGKLRGALASLELNLLRGI